MLYIFRTQEIIYFYANGIFRSYPIILNGCKEYYIKKASVLIWNTISLLSISIQHFNFPGNDWNSCYSQFNSFIHTLTYLLQSNKKQNSISHFKFQIQIVVVKSFIHDRISNESKHQFHFSICIPEIVTRIVLSTSVALL